MCDVPPPTQHSTPAPALAQTSLLSFLVHSPLPTLVLPLSPLLDSLLQRTAKSPLRTPVWTGQRRNSESSEAEKQAAAAVAAGDASALLGSIEQLNVKTPIGIPETSAGGGGDYFSLVTEQTMPSPTPSSNSSSSSTGTTTSFSHTPATPIDISSSSSNYFGDAGWMANALKPVYRNEAWRSLESGTRRNSAAPQKEVPTSTRGGSRGGSRRQSVDDHDVLMSGLPGVSRGDSFGSRSSGSRGASPLGTVEEEQYSMETDDEDDEPWQSAYSFLLPEEQTALLNFVLDCLEKDDGIAAFLPSAAPFSSSNHSNIPYASPSAVSPGSSPTSQSNTFTPRWTQPQPDAVASTFTFNQGSFSRTSSFVAGSASNPNSSPSTAGRPSKSRSNSPPYTSTPSPSTPNVVRIDDYVLSATIVPVPAGAYPPTGFVVLTGPPPSPPPSAPPTSSQGWLPNKWPSRPIINSNSTSTSVSTVAATSTPAKAPTDQMKQKYAAFKSPAAATSSLLPSLPRGADEIMDPYLAALGNGEMAKLIREYRWENCTFPLFVLTLSLAFTSADPLYEQLRWVPSPIGRRNLRRSFRACSLRRTASASCTVPRW
jgi:hypothetical protein